jgi:hypothetical protein
MDNEDNLSVTLRPTEISPGFADGLDRATSLRRGGKQGCEDFSEGRDTWHLSPVFG